MLPSNGLSVIYSYRNVIMQQKAAIKNSLTTKGTKNIQNAKDTKKNLQKKKFLRGNTICPALLTKVFFAASTQIAHMYCAYLCREKRYYPAMDKPEPNKHKAQSKF